MQNTELKVLPKYQCKNHSYFFFHGEDIIRFG